MIPQNARSVLSIGCGSGATECQLVERGFRVFAVPLDPIISSTAAARGVELVSGDFHAVKNKLKDEQIDCVLYLNVLHLTRDPVQVLSLFTDLLADTGIVIIASPNMMCASSIWRRFSNIFHLPDVGKRNWKMYAFCRSGECEPLVYESWVKSRKDSWDLGPADGDHSPPHASCNSRLTSRFCKAFHGRQFRHRSSQGVNSATIPGGRNPAFLTQAVGSAFHLTSKHPSTR